MDIDSSIPPLSSLCKGWHHQDHTYHDCKQAFGFDFDIDSEFAVSDETPLDPEHPSTTGASFAHLPVEILEAILDQLFGTCTYASSTSKTSASCLKQTQHTAMRKSRRRELADLALVNCTMRELVQTRLYRTIKLKGTWDVLTDAAIHFGNNDHHHLKEYTRHLEIWFPVFQATYVPMALSGALALPTVTPDCLTNATYVLPRNNCTLEEVFEFAAATFPEVRVLTLEGGERKKAPMVRHFQVQDPIAPRDLPIIPTVTTLVTKGQWNLARDNGDFSMILEALPNLKQWHSAYSKPKSKSYITISNFLPLLPSNIKDFRLSIEPDYKREPVIPPFYTKVAVKTHICRAMAGALPKLEHFSYTGRVCHSLFDIAAKLTNTRSTRLSSIDITVKNCCRPLSHFHESGSGIQDMGFIDAFEKLVISAIRSLAVLIKVEYMRIRFVDLGRFSCSPFYDGTCLTETESVLPPLNPFFLMQNDRCSGVWSPQVISELNRVRPTASFVELSETFGNISYNKEGRMVVTPDPENPDRKVSQVSSLKLSNYRLLAHRITIQ